MDMKEFGLRIKQRREALSLTQEQVAGKMATRTLQRLEDGVGNPTLSTIVEIASALRISPAELISDGEYPKASPPPDIPSWQDMAELLHDYGACGPERRLLSRYIMTDDEGYLADYVRLPDAPRIAGALKKVL